MDCSHLFHRDDLLASVDYKIELGVYQNQIMSLRCLANNRPRSPIVSSLRGTRAFNSSLRHRWVRSYTPFRPTAIWLHDAQRSYTQPASAIAAHSHAESSASSLSQAHAGRLAAIRNLLVHDLGGAGPWSEHLEYAQEQLELRKQCCVAGAWRVREEANRVVYGESSVNSQNVVSAMIRNPLGETPQSREAIVDRYRDHGSDTLTIVHAETLTRTTKVLQTPSPWIQNLQSQLEEINLTEKDEVLRKLLVADVALVVLDPMQLLRPADTSYIVADLAHKTGLVLLVDGPLPYATSEASLHAALMEQYRAASPKAPDPTVIFTQANIALEALDSLQHALDQPTLARRHESVEDFQTGFRTSQIGALQHRISSLVQTAQRAGPGQLASEIGDAALGSIDRMISRERQANLQADGTVQQLVRLATRVASEAKRLSVIHRGIEGGLVEGGVKHTVTTARKGIEASLRERWSWLNLVLKARADVVGSELSSYLERTFGRQMEVQLIFETGQLAQLQKTLSNQTDDTLQRLAAPRSMPHPLSSPVLINHLSTLTLSIPAYDATSLLGPIDSRRQQLIREAVPRLQLSAQRTLLASLSLSTIGVVASWICYVPPLALVSGPTALGIGLLSIIGNLALGQRRWSKAQGKFWMDWDRITDMLRGDLQAVLDETIKANLLAKPLAAADGLEDIIKRREKRLDDLQTKARQLRRDTQA